MVLDNVLKEGRAAVCGRERTAQRAKQHLQDMRLVYRYCGQLGRYDLQWGDQTG